MVEIDLLGPPRVRLRGQEIVLAARKSAALLYYLAARPGLPVGRGQIVALFWEEHGEAEGRNSLSTALSRLRRALESGDGTPFPLATVGDGLAWQPGAGRRTDLAAFEELTASPDAGAAELAQALALYRGPFLDGFEVRDSAGFEEWLAREREGWQQRVLAVSRRLVVLAEQDGRLDRAIGYAQRALALDPLSEQSHRTLIDLHDRNGDRASALAQFAACERLLREGLDVAPSAETRRLRDAVVAGRAAAATPRGARASAGRTPTPSQALSGLGALTPRYRLVGREVELRRLWRQVEATPDRPARFVGGIL